MSSGARGRTTPNASTVRGPQDSIIWYWRHAVNPASILTILQSDDPVGVEAFSEFPAGFLERFARNHSAVPFAGRGGKTDPFDDSHGSKLDLQVAGR